MPQNQALTVIAFKAYVNETVENFMADIHWNYKEFKMETKEREKEMETWAEFIAQFLKTVAKHIKTIEE